MSPPCIHRSGESGVSATPEGDVGVLSRLLESEREHKSIMQAEYERQLAQLRAESVTKIAASRAQVVREMEDTLRRYQRVAEEALRASKTAGAEARAAEREARANAQNACEKFEESCKAKLKEVLEGYKYLADRATQQAAVDVAEIKGRYEALLLANERRQEELQKEVVRAAEELLAPYKLRTQQLETENRRLRADAEAAVRFIEEETGRTFARFETTLISSALSLLWQHDIPISEIALRAKLADAADELVQGIEATYDDEDPDYDHDSFDEHNSLEGNIRGAVYQPQSQLMKSDTSRPDNANGSQTLDHPPSATDH